MSTRPRRDRWDLWQIRSARASVLPLQRRRGMLPVFQEVKLLDVVNTEDCKGSDSGLIATGTGDLGAYGDADRKRSDSGLVACTGSGIAAGIFYEVSPAKVSFA